MASAPYPGAYAPVIAPGGTFFALPWLAFFQQFASQPAAPSTITATGSPFAYTASGPGSFFINGGTISDREFTRGGVTVPFGSNIVNMANNDRVTITYTGSPSFVFIPA